MGPSYASGSTIVRVTSAIPRGLRSRVPAKITSCMFAPRRLFALCSPSTQLTPSRMFDLPQPFGPTTTAMPVPGTVSSVRSQKLLKPRMWIFFSFSMLTPGHMGYESLLSGSASFARIRSAGEEYPLITDSKEPKSQGQSGEEVFLWIRGAGTPLLGYFKANVGNSPIFIEFRPRFPQVGIPENLGSDMGKTHCFSDHLLQCPQR